MTLEILWFCAIAVLWGGYFLLEGFDFGVGQLLPFLARDEDERSAILGTIGPHWDGNEVWLVIAAGATFAAFPAWYATMFSAFYLVLLLILVLLIVRVVSFEWRERDEGARWRGAWRWANTVEQRRRAVPVGRGAGEPPLRHPAGRRTATSPGTCSTCSAPTRSPPGSRSCCCSRSTARRSSRCARGRAVRAGGARAARRLASRWRSSWPRSSPGPWPSRSIATTGTVRAAGPGAVGGLALASASCSRVRGRSGWAFGMTALASLSVVATLFTALYPRVLVSAAEPAEQPHDLRTRRPRTTRSA